jgi:UDP-glucose 6-dehydrogenase
VYGVDVSEKRLEQIRNREHFVEPQVNKYLEKYGNNLTMSSNYSILSDCEVIFIITQTPSLPSRKFDISYVKEALTNVVKKNSKCLVVISSTINIGDMNELQKIHKRIVYNPEFIKQGSILNDFSCPRFVLIGAFTENDGIEIAKIWRKYHAKPVFIVKPVEAEIIKLSLNVSFTLGITFANMTGELCEKFDADSNKVLDVIYQDRRNYKAGLGFSGPCLAPSANVQTINGLKPISLIEEGDYVLSHRGQWRKVTKIYKTSYNGKIIRLMHQGIEVSITPDHLALGRAIERPNCYINRSRGQLRKNSRRKILPISWRPISSLEDDFLFAFPIPLFSKAFREEHIRGHKEKIIKVSTNFMRIIGYYLAEGWANRKQCSVEFSFNSKETDYIHDLQVLFDEVFGLKLSPHRSACLKTSTRLRNGSKSVAEFLLSTIGSGASKKNIPIEWLNTSQENRIELLKGLFRGDGCFSEGLTKNGFNQASFTYATISHELFNQVKLILLDLGIAFGSHVIPLHGIHKKSYWIKINGSYYQKLKQIFGMKYKEQPKGKASHKEVWIQNAYSLSPMRKNKVAIESYDGFVYNLEVEEDNSYCLESITVHNCFPRDVDCFKHACIEHSVGSGHRLANLLNDLNNYTVLKYVEKIKSYGFKRVGMLGVAYKVGVGYIDESQPIKIAKKLLADGYEVYVYDPLAEENAKKELTGNVCFCSSESECVEKSEVIFVGTSNFGNVEAKGKIVLNPWM